MHAPRDLRRAVRDALDGPAEQARIGRTGCGWIRRSYYEYSAYSTPASAQDESRRRAANLGAPESGILPPGRPASVNATSRSVPRQSRATPARAAIAGQSTASASPAASQAARAAPRAAAAALTPRCRRCARPTRAIAAARDSGSCPRRIRAARSSAGRRSSRTRLRRWADSGSTDLDESDLLELAYAATSARRTSISGRTTGDREYIAASPLADVWRGSRRTRITTVSSWSSRVCAVTTVAESSRAQPVRNSQRAARQAASPVYAGAAGVRPPETTAPNGGSPRAPPAARPWSAAGPVPWSNVAAATASDRKRANASSRTIDRGRPRPRGDTGPAAGANRAGDSLQEIPRPPASLARAMRLR